MSQFSPYTNIHTHQAEENDVLSIFSCMAGCSLPEGLVSLGLHPGYISGDYLEKLEQVRDLASEKNVLAIGECGLDRLADVDFELQEKVFTEQICIAEKVNKPLIIHCVRAYDQLIRIKKEQMIKVPLIVHGFNNKAEIAEQLLKHEIFISFGKALLTNSSNASAVIRDYPLHRIFLETDDADISIKRIFEAAALHRGLEPDKMKEIIHTNFKHVFNYG